jgi:acyl-coenzyme A thioesterase PaaI-like protein
LKKKMFGGCRDPQGDTLMQIVDDGNCFICGKDNPIGLKAVFDIDPAQRRAATTVRIPETYQGWQGITHGGIISSLLDEVCAQACMGAGLQIVTSEMRLRYRAPVPTGSLVTVIGEVIGERRRLVDVKGRLELDGKIMAVADVVMYRTDFHENPA